MPETAYETYEALKEAVDEGGVEEFVVTASSSMDEVGSNLKAEIESVGEQIDASDHLVKQAVEQLTDERRNSVKKQYAQEYLVPDKKAE